MIDSTIKQSDDEPLYPYLAINNFGDVILFISINKGVVVGSKDPSRVLGYLGEFIETSHEPFHGSVTLRDH